MGGNRVCLRDFVGAVPTIMPLSTDIYMSGSNSEDTGTDRRRRVHRRHRTRTFVCSCCDCRKYNTIHGRCRRRSLARSVLFTNNTKARVCECIGCRFLCGRSSVFLSRSGHNLMCGNDMYMYVYIRPARHTQYIRTRERARVFAHEICAHHRVAVAAAVAVAAVAVVPAEKKI